MGATLVAWRRLEHRQLGAGYRTFPDRALEPWNGEVRPFDPKQSLLTDKVASLNPKLPFHTFCSRLDFIAHA